MQIIPLRQMKKGQSGSIFKVKATGELGRRIREMGLIPGTRVTIYGKAPLQDPVAIRVLNTTLTLRNNEAEFIQIEID
jgi:ferrous iron transport protein A